MTRPIRYLPHPGAVVEITQRTAEGRFLFRPSERLNAIVAGCFSRAQKITGATLHAVAVLSNHFHVLATFDTVEQMSRFMCHLKTNLSKEIRRLHGWKGAVFEGRYHHVPLSDEATVQIERLRYILRQGTKEGLVLSPREWPGVHSAKALEQGKPILGVWIDRTEHYQAKQRDSEIGEAPFCYHEELHLAPLPCWAETPKKVIQGWIAEIIQEIESETRRQHRRQQTAPRGVGVILSENPLSCATRLVKSPKPKFHATRAVRQALTRGFRDFVQAYRRSAELLAAGHLRVRFPENCYPPRLAFVNPLPV